MKLQRIRNLEGNSSGKRGQPGYNGSLTQRDDMDIARNNGKVPDEVLVRWAELDRLGQNQNGEYPPHMNPKHRTPLRERKFGDEGNIDDDIQAWNLRNHPDVLRKKKTTTKPKRAIKKKVAKKCRCK
jgi:hypothetical protein